MRLLDWDFGEAEARRITQRVLVVLGGSSIALSPRFEETYQFLMDHLPHAEGFILPDATHFLHLETLAAARGIAKALTEFYTRYPQTAYIG